MSKKLVSYSADSHMLETEGDPMKRIFDWLSDPDNNGVMLLAVLIFCATCVAASFALVTP